MFSHTLKRGPMFEYRSGHINIPSREIIRHNIFISAATAAAAGVEVERSFFSAMRPQFGQKRQRPQRKNVKIAMPSHNKGSHKRFIG